MARCATKKGVSDIHIKGKGVSVTDLIGFGKLGKVIPPEVFTQTSAAVQSTFLALTAPLTETTAGLGRYIRQKFDSMVEAERAVATFTIGEALKRARANELAAGREISPPSHLKSFVRTIEEAAKETDPLLHELWTNLLAVQLTTVGARPHDVQVLSHLGRADAELLLSLRSRLDIGPNGGGFLSFGNDKTEKRWIRHSSEVQSHPWDATCDLLVTLGMVDMASCGMMTEIDPVILFRNKAGDRFLHAVGAL